MVKYTTSAALIFTAMLGLVGHNCVHATSIANETKDKDESDVTAGLPEALELAEKMTGEEKDDPDNETKELEKLLHEALLRGNSKVIDDILNTNPELADSPDENGWTKLHEAAYLGNLESVILLVEKGQADIHAVHNGGEKALDVAKRILDDDNHAVIVYLEKVHTRKENETYRDLLKEAILRENLKVVSNILSEKPNVANFRDENGWSALHIAARQGILNTVKLLVENGNADIYAKTGIYRDGDSVSRIALQYLGSANHEVVKYLSDLKLEHKEHQNLLRQAVHDENTDEIADIIKAKPYLIRMKDSNGWTQLHEAARVGNIETVKLLVEKGNANVNARIGDYHDGLTVLDVALEIFKSENHEVVRYLREKGALTTEEEEEKYHKVLLREALLHENTQVISSVLEKMPHIIHSRDENGWTHLHQAVRLGNPEVVKLLVEKGNADVNAKHVGGESVMDVAKKYLGSAEHNVVKYLENLVSPS